MMSFLSESHMFSKMGQRQEVQVVGSGIRSVYPEDTDKCLTMTAALFRGNNVIRL